jgi:transposase
MIQEEHSRSLNEHPTHSTETERQRSGRARMSAQYKLWASRSMEAQPTAGQSPSLSSEQQNRLTQISRCADELARCVAERENAHTLGDKWGVWLGEMDWYTELHRLLYEEE